MGIASFTCYTFLSTELDIFSTLSEHHKLKNLLAKIEKVRMIHDLFQNFKTIAKNAHYFCLYIEMHADNTEQSIKYR